MSAYTLTEKIGVILVIVGVVTGLVYGVFYPNPAEAPGKSAMPLPPENNAKDTVRLTGAVVEGGVECLRFRADDNTYYTIAGNLSELGGIAIGDRLEIEGKIAEISYCQQDTTIEVHTLGRLSSSPSPTPATDTSNWKTYRNEEYGFALRHPPYLGAGAPSENSVLGTAEEPVPGIYVGTVVFVIAEDDLLKKATIDYFATLKNFADHPEQYQEQVSCVRQAIPKPTVSVELLRCNRAFYGLIKGGSYDIFVDGYSRGFNTVQAEMMGEFKNFDKEIGLMLSTFTFTQ
ncbi:MAG: hypothetical protein Q8R13_04325 [bacterium]|nr:hypothetical protein [bacterium]MDZ4296628.1 hypothetical protein [Patescibacteria group bacterium]